LAKWLRIMPDVEPLPTRMDGMRTGPIMRRWTEHRMGKADHRMVLWSWLVLQYLASAGRMGSAAEAA
jgi:hypothetical protein